MKSRIPNNCINIFRYTSGLYRLKASEYIDFDATTNPNSFVTTDVLVSVTNNPILLIPHMIPNNKFIVNGKNESLYVFKSPSIFFATSLTRGTTGELTISETLLTLLSIMVPPVHNLVNGWHHVLQLITQLVYSKYCLLFPQVIPLAENVLSCGPSPQQLSCRTLLTN